MTLRSKYLSIIIILIMFGGIMISSALGWWLTESTKEVAVITEGEFAGLPNPEDIRGSYTFGDIENNFNIPAELLTQAFVIQTDDAGTFQIKNLETQFDGSEFEIGTASVRLFVAFYANLPLDLNLEEGYLPKQAVDILKNIALTDEQKIYLDSHSIDISAFLDGASLSIDEIEENHDESDTTVKGKTTFAEVLSWGVSEQTIEEILGFPIPEEKLTSIKDTIIANGLVFESVKENLQIAIDSLE